MMMIACSNNKSPIRNTLSGFNDKLCRKLFSANNTKLSGFLSSSKQSPKVDAYQPFFSIFAAGLFSQGVLHYNLLYQIHGELVAVLLLLSFTRLMCVGSNMNLKRTTTTSARGQATQQNFSAKEAKSQFVPCQPFSDKTTGDEGISFTF